MFEDLLRSVDRNRLPLHVGIIMDGNGRWAVARGLPRVEGHKEGLRALERILEFNRYLRIPYITVYAFSKENWYRDKEEVEFLMSMAVKVMKEKLDEFREKGVRFIHLGDKDGLSEELVRIIGLLEEETKKGELYTLCAAFNYSGRSEIVSAIRSIVEAFEKGEVNKVGISEGLVSRYIYHPEVPDVDLIIRTSGEQRISNFMLWRSAYSEFYFTSVLWPDFEPRHFVEAIREYQLRERRFGRLKR